MNVLSLFDGMSCGQIALNKANIPYNQYFASEIDKWAIKVTQHNYPNTIQVGDVTELKASVLPKIDLLIGGSPCQGFSIAGKKLNFDDPRSKLFFEYVRLKNELKPKYFLLENVRMKKEWQDIISRELGVEPIEINSAHYSAQHRRRLYWTNIPFTASRKIDISLSSILEDNVEGIVIEFIDDKCEFYDNNGRLVCIDSINYPYTFYETRTEEGKAIRKEIKKSLGIDTTPRNKKYKMYKPRLHNKSNCITTTSSCLDYIVDKEGKYRKLTIMEIERLQTIPDGYTNGVSDSQRRRMIGNGWTIRVIENILSGIK